MSMAETMGLEIDGLAFTLSRLNGIREEKNAPYFDEKAAEYILETVNDCTAVKKKIVDTINALKPDFIPTKIIWGEVCVDSEEMGFYRHNFRDGFVFDLKLDGQKVKCCSDGAHLRIAPRSMESVLNGITVANIVREDSKSKITFFYSGNVYFGKTLLNLRNLFGEIVKRGVNFSPTEWNWLVNIANDTKKETEDILAAFKAAMGDIIKKLSRDIENCENSTKRLADIRYEKIES